MTNPITPNAPLTAKALAATLAQSQGISRKQAERLLGAMFVNIAFALANRQEVRLADFGVFGWQQVPARSGNSPVCGAWTKPAHRKIVFCPAKALRDVVSET